MKSDGKMRWFQITMCERWPGSTGRGLPDASNGDGATSSLPSRTSAPPQPSAIHCASRAGLAFRRHTAPACSIRSSSRTIFCGWLKSFSYTGRKSYPDRSSGATPPAAVCIVAFQTALATHKNTQSKTASRISLSSSFSLPPAPQATAKKLTDQEVSSPAGQRPALPGRRRPQSGGSPYGVQASACFSQVRIQKQAKSLNSIPSQWTLAVWSSSFSLLLAGSNSKAS